MPVRKASTAAAVETDPPDYSKVPDSSQIGTQIRELRKIKSLTLKQLSAAAGISIGYLSQIERNNSALPIGVLKKISTALGVQLHWFFQPIATPPAEERDNIVRGGNRRNMTFTGTGISEELLSPNLSGPLEMLMSTIQPGADSKPYRHEGDEAGYVVSGTLDLWIGGKKHRLYAGDSFSFPSTLEHRCANPGKVPTKVIWIITPPHY